MLIRLIEALEEAIEPEDMPWAPERLARDAAVDNVGMREPHRKYDDSFYAALDREGARAKKRAGMKGWFRKYIDPKYHAPIVTPREYHNPEPPVAMDIDRWNALLSDMRSEAADAVDPPKDGDYEALAYQYAVEQASHWGYTCVVDDIAKDAPKILIKLPGHPGYKPPEPTVTEGKKKESR